MQKLVFITLATLFIIFLPPVTYSSVRFTDYAMSDSGRIAFVMSNDHNTCPAALLSNTSNNDNLQLLTCDGSDMQFLSNNTLMIRSSYGTLWCDTSSENDGVYRLSQKNVFNSIIDTTLFLPPIATDNSISYSCTLVQNKSSSATGDLILKDLKSQKIITLDQGTLLDYKKPHAIWTASGLLLYEKANAIYFANPQSLFDGTEVETEYRKITNGTISCIKCIGNTITYISGDTIYQVSAKELYTLSLYGSLTGMGRPIGHLASNFNTTRDDFFIDNSGENIVVRTANTYTLYTKSGNDLTIVAQKTFANTAYLVLNFDIFFVTDGSQTVTYLWMTALPFLSTVDSDNLMTYVYIYNVTQDFDLTLTVEDSAKLIPSPNTTLCAIPCGQSLYIYDTITWKRLDTVAGSTITNAVWQNDSTLFVATPATIYKYDVSERHKYFVTLASATKLSFLDNTNIICVAPDKNRYIYNTAGNYWKEYIEIFPKQKYSNTTHRIFTGKTSNERFENALYIRDIKTSASYSVFADSVKKQSLTKRIALIFDAYDSVEGLGSILYTLGRHKVDATFFLNGEFISRHPKETKLLSSTHYECASMFFTKAPLTGNNFTVDSNFIKQGLGRLEDEYFSVTGKEISLLWHAPYYFVTDEIIKYGSDAGYIYMKNTNLTQENIYRADSNQNITPAVMAKRLVNIYMNTIAFSTSRDVVIPITIGESDADSIKSYRVRGTYQTLVDNLDLLINAILSCGYEIVNVRALL